jgi:hypothetical protein
MLPVQKKRKKSEKTTWRYQASADYTILGKYSQWLMVLTQIDLYIYAPDQTFNVPSWTWNAIHL